MDVMSDSTKTNGLAPLWWALIALLIVEIAVRFVVDPGLRAILIVETVSFLAVATVFLALLRWGPELSNRKRGALGVLAVAFLLGAVRSGLWAAGFDVYRANLTILSIALIALAVLGWRRRVSRLKNERPTRH